jgi:hypothetical protein
VRIPSLEATHAPKATPAPNVKEALAPQRRSHERTPTPGPGSDPHGMGAVVAGGPAGVRCWCASTAGDPGTWTTRLWAAVLRSGLTAGSQAGPLAALLIAAIGMGGVVVGTGMAIASPQQGLAIVGACDGRWVVGEAGTDDGARIRWFLRPGRRLARACMRGVLRL